MKHAFVYALLPPSFGQSQMVNYLKLFAATDIKIWHGKSGKELGTVDTNQLKNNMADISPNG